MPDHAAIRPYAELVEAIFADLSGRETDAAERMQRFVDLAWPLLSPTGVSWLGFYTPVSDEAAARSGLGAGELSRPCSSRPPASPPAAMVLGPHRDTPACSPIGLHGACGRSLLERRAIVVRDVAALGPNYIACDPRDRSELVVPLLSGATDSPDPSAPACAGVLDLDSFAIDAFGPHDAAALSEAIEAAGLGQPIAPDAVRVL